VCWKPSAWNGALAAYMPRTALTVWLAGDSDRLVLCGTMVISTVAWAVFVEAPVAVIVYVTALTGCCDVPEMIPVPGSMKSPVGSAGEIL